MNIIIDTHTHSISSGHAYSTIQEISIEAFKKGIKMFAITDHGPTMLGAPSSLHFANLGVLPKIINDVRVIKGIEANIINFDGKLDLEEKFLERLEYVIASLHDICIESSSIEDNTNAIIGAIRNPYVDAIGHPGNPIFEVDIEKVVAACKEYGKFIEINNHSFIVRKGSEINCKKFAMECKRKSVKVVCGSDAHSSFGVGAFDNVKKIFEDVNMPEELVICTSVEKFENYLLNRKDRIKKVN